MNSLEDQIKQIRKRQEQARQKKARADIQLEAAKKTADKLRSKLKAQIGTDTVEEAKSIASSMERELKEIMEDISARLDVFE